MTIFGKNTNVLNFQYKTRYICMSHTMVSDFINKMMTTFDFNFEIISRFLTARMDKH